MKRFTIAIERDVERDLHIPNAPRTVNATLRGTLTDWCLVGCIGMREAMYGHPHAESRRDLEVAFGSLCPSFIMPIINATKFFYDKVQILVNCSKPLTKTLFSHTQLDYEV